MQSRDNNVTSMSRAERHFKIFTFSVNLPKSPIVNHWNVM